MELLFWSCFVGGALYTLISTLFGDLLGGWLEGVFDFLSADFLKPVVTASAITTFGGSGVLLTRYTSMSAIVIVILAVLIALILSVIIYFGYVKPMENSENSIGFSTSELPGKLGEVTIPIPSNGYGEVMIKLVSGNTLHIASSWDRKDISVGRLVVVVNTEDGVVQVSELYEQED